MLIARPEMLIRYMGILLLVSLCVAHNGRRGGSYGSKSSGCQRSHHYGKSSKSNHYHKEYHHQPRKKPTYYDEHQKKHVLSLVEDVVFTIIKPLCEKEPKHYPHEPERSKKKRRKPYIDDTRESEEYEEYRHKKQKQRPRKKEVRRPIIDYDSPEYLDNYEDIQQQPPRRISRYKYDNYKQRRTEEPTKKEKCKDCKQPRRNEDMHDSPTDNNDRPNNNRRSPQKPQYTKTKHSEKSNKKTARDDYNDDFPDDDYPEDNFPLNRNNVQQPIQPQNQAYDQYEYYYYEDYSGFVV